MTTYAVSETGEHVTYRWCQSRADIERGPGIERLAERGFELDVDPLDLLADDAD